MNVEGKDPCELAEIVYEKPLAGVFEEKSFGSDLGNTLWVKFSDAHGINEWIGKFGTGVYGSNYIEKVGEPDQFFVSAGGFGYLIDATQRKVLDHHFDEFSNGIAYDPKSKRYIVAGHTHLRLIQSGQTLWESMKFATDGIRNFKVEGRIIKGFATIDYEGKETEFAFDMDALTIQLLKAK